MRDLGKAEAMAEATSEAKVIAIAKAKVKRGYSATLANACNLAARDCTCMSQLIQFNL